MIEKSKQTPLYDEHMSLGAKMIDFHGWRMPLYYSSIIKEVKSVRRETGLFDLSHMGEIIIKGENAFSFLQFVTTNDVSKLKTGQMQYSFFLSPQGTVLDDFMLYHLENEFIFIFRSTNKNIPFCCNQFIFKTGIMEPAMFV